MVAYLEVFVLIYHTWIKEWGKAKQARSIWHEFYTNMSAESVLQSHDLALVGAVALGVTILRYLATKNILRPLGQKFGFRAKDQIKFPESTWKLTFYFLSFVYECYLLLWQYPEYLTDIQSQWIGWDVGMKIQTDIYALYILQAGFYFHSIFATLCMDMWRKDTFVMVLHHLLALSLILFSMAIRCHRIGLVVLFLHDLADVFLEFTKIVTCFNNKPNKPKVSEVLVVGGFICFAITWFVQRLYVYPLVVLYSSGHVSRIVLPHITSTFYFFFNLQLWLLFFMNIWWFHFIVWLIVRLLTGKSRTVEDTRELSDDEKEQKQQKKKKTNAYTNGSATNNRATQNGTASLKNDVTGVHKVGDTQTRKRVVNGDIH